MATEEVKMQNSDKHEPSWVAMEECRLMGTTEDPIKEL
jgi:hypothetical protein